LCLLKKSALLVWKCLTKTATSSWTVLRPGLMLRQSAKASHGKEIKDTWYLFTQRRSSPLFQVFQVKDCGLVVMTYRRRVTGLGLMVLQQHTKTGIQITQVTMAVMNIAWSSMHHQTENGMILTVPTSSSLFVSLQKVFNGERYMVMT